MSLCHDHLGYSYYITDIAETAGLDINRKDSPYSSC